MRLVLHKDLGSTTIQLHLHLFRTPRDDQQDTRPHVLASIGSLIAQPSMRDDILEGFYKLRIRESEKLKTVLELYNMEIHQKKAGPDYHRLKTMV